MLWFARIVALVALTSICLSPITAPALAAETQPPFAGRWIDVDLNARTATAYEGSRALRTVPITAGKPGFETPRGIFYVRSRVADETMDSASLGIARDGPEGYYLKHVRYVQYISSDGTALHANYWMPDWVFGRADTSHGCVGMREADAAYFWDFATYGTPVVIHTSENALVESVVGKPVEEAKGALSEAGFQVEVAEQAVDGGPIGAVLAQKPAGGERARRGSVVTITVGAARPAPPPAPTPAPVRPPEGNTAWVPDVVGLPEAEARRRVEQAGLTNTYTNFQVESDVPESARPFFQSIAPGSVLSTSPGPGEKVLKGSAVKLAVRKP